MAESLYPKVHAWSNLLQAHAQATRGKRGHGPAADFEVRLSDNLLSIRDDLVHKTYVPGRYQSFYIHEPNRASFRRRRFATASSIMRWSTRSSPCSSVVSSSTATPTGRGRAATGRSTGARLSPDVIVSFSSATCGGTSPRSIISSFDGFSNG